MHVHKGEDESTNDEVCGLVACLCLSVIVSELEVPTFLTSSSFILLVRSGVMVDGVSTGK